LIKEKRKKERKKKKTLISIELVAFLVGQVTICTNESFSFNMLLLLPDMILNKIYMVQQDFTSSKLTNYFTLSFCVFSKMSLTGFGKNTICLSDSLAQECDR
jgi:hypothetical protein